MNTLPLPIHDDNPTEKRCKGPCDRLLPATSEFFYRNKGCKDGLLPTCKQCRSAQDKTHYDEHREEKITYSKRYYAEHHEERRTYNTKYSEEHREELRQYAAKRFEEYHEELCEQQRQYYKDYRETIMLSRARHYEDNYETIRERSRQYYQTDRGRIAHRAAGHNRRALKRKAKGTHTVEDLHQQLLRQKSRCYYCKIKLGKGRGAWHADHIVPLSRGGSNSIDNIVITCPTCNLKKHNKLPHEFLDGGRLL